MNSFDTKANKKTIISNVDGMQWAMILAASLLLTAVMTASTTGWFRSELPEVGQIVPRTITSPRDLLVEDRKSTVDLRLEAEARAPRVFRLDYDPASTRQEVESAFSSLKDMLTSSGDSPQLSKRAAEDLFKTKFSDDEWAMLSDSSRWPRISAGILQKIEPVLSKGVVADDGLFQQVVERGPVLLHLSSDAGNIQASVKDIVPIADALHQVSAVKAASRSQGENASLEGAIDKLARTFVKPNVVFDADTTEKLVSRARRSVPKNYIRIQLGEVVARAGDKLTDKQWERLQLLFGHDDPTHLISAAAGFFVLTFLALAIPIVFVRIAFPAHLAAHRDLILTLSTIVGTVLLFQVGNVVAAAVSVSYPEIHPMAFALAMPLAVGGIVLQVTVGAIPVAVLTASSSLLAMIYFPEKWVVVPTAMLAILIGALSVSVRARRSSFLLAGVKVAALETLAGIGFLLLHPPSEVDHLTAIPLAGCIGGVLAGIFASGLLPLVEVFGGYITDSKLLELGSLDRPLLRELSLQAPGTWNHSVLLAHMSEVAAEAIGANPLLCRVAAYYHDIGKIKKPQYFIENQGGKENRHDKLSPSMSALIIKSHVKEGVDLARQHKLPQRVIDFIRQHHGTNLIEFFFEKAKKEAAPGDTVDESLYRYPGPKPQSKEAGILMLADGVEASTRSLNDHSQPRIQGIVQKIINKVFASGQLDESNLTLRDLHLVAKSFTRILCGVYHRRIEYPDPIEPAQEVKVQKSQPKTEELQVELVADDVKDALGNPIPAELFKQASLRRLGIQ